MNGVGPNVAAVVRQGKIYVAGFTQGTDAKASYAKA